MRNIEDTSSYSHLFLLPNSLTHLDIVQLDLLDDFEAISWKKSFTETINDVIYVGTSASVFFNQRDKDLVTKYTEPCVVGIEKVCQYCKETLSVNKLIMTSCISGKIPLRLNISISFMFHII